MTPDLYHRGQIHNTPEPPANTVGIDWLSMTGKEPAWADQARGVLSRTCFGKPEHGHGLHNYARRETWPCTARLFTGHEHSGGMVDLPGDACEILGGKVVASFIRDLIPKGRCTRLDIACDYFGSDAVSLLQNARDSCRRGEFVGVRTFKHFSEGDAKSPDESTGLYLGSTKSPRFVRIYDKGLEQGDRPRGEWIRWEAQFRDDHADKAARTIAAFGDDWGVVARSTALHAVEFLQDPDETNNDRREPVPWYARLVEDTLQFRTRLEPTSTTLDGFLGHAERSVFRTIKAAADRAGVPFVKALEFLSVDTQTTDSTWKNPTVFLLADHLKSLALAV